MKSFIEKIRLADKKSHIKNLPIDSYLRRARIGAIEPSERVLKKYSPFINLSGQDERSIIEYFDYASDLNIRLPNPLKIDAEKVTRMRVEAKRKTLPVTCPYKALSPIVSKNNLRPSMTGIHHKNGYIEATDGHVLVRAKSGYTSSLEGVILTPDILRDKIDETYPDLHTAIAYALSGPTNEKVTCDLSILLGKLDRMAFFANNMHSESKIAVSIFDQGNFDVLLIKKIVSCMIQLGVELAEIVVSKRLNGGIIIASLDNDTIGMSMSLLRDSIDNHPEFMIGEEEVNINIKQ